MYTLEECAKKWDEAGQHGSPQERIARGEKWLPYYSYLAKKQSEEPFSLTEKPGECTAVLIREGVLQENDSVLDIGAGMGNYALEFARYCRQVTAIDMNEDCLALLRQRAEQCGMEHIETVTTPWETFRPEKKYDLVFSSMCPAICNLEELKRMEAMSLRSCCLISVMRGSYDKHRKAMMKELGIRPQGGMVTEAIHYINALYLMNRKVNVKCISTGGKSRISAERVLEQYPIYFRVFGVEEERSAAFLKDYLARNSVDGYLEEESRLNLAIIDWKVEECL